MVSQNFIWLSVFALVITFVLLAFVYFKEIKIIFSDKNLLVLLLSFPIVGLFSKTLSVTWILESRLNLSILLVVISLITAFVFGLLTKIVLQMARGEKPNFFYALSSIKSWFASSVLAFGLGFGGNLLIFYLFSNSEFHIRAFLLLVWSAVTFTLYPLLITDKENIFYTLLRAFKITFFTVHKWFYLFLIIIFVSGEFLQLFPSSAARVSWTGGYSFQPIWFDLMIKSADLSPTIATCIYVVVLFICSVTATLVKLKLTKTMIDLGYISNNPSETLAR